MSAPRLPAALAEGVAALSVDGYELAHRMRQYPDLRKVVLVALTGHGRDEDRERAFAAGFDYHSVKPVNPDALQGLVGRLGKADPGKPPTVH